LQGGDRCFRSAKFALQSGRKAAGIRGNLIGLLIELLPVSVRDLEASANLLDAGLQMIEPGQAAGRLGTVDDIVGAGGLSELSRHGKLLACGLGAATGFLQDQLISGDGRLELIEAERGGLQTISRVEGIVESGAGCRETELIQACEGRGEGRA
jgi:hypothetical protein